VHVLERQKNFCGVETSLVFVELSVAFEEGEKVAASHEVQNKEVLEVALKGKVQTNDEGVGHLRRGVRAERGCNITPQVVHECFKCDGSVTHRFEHFAFV
jgi:hypothetical protein